MPPSGVIFGGINLSEIGDAPKCHLQTRTQGSKDFAHILSYIPAESLESVVSACSVAIKSNTISKDVILNILLRKKDEPGAIYKPTNIIHIKLKIAPTDDCSRYNQLLKVGV